jgi:hypothetical protein
MKVKLIVIAVAVILLVTVVSVMQPNNPPKRTTGIDNALATNKLRALQGAEALKSRMRNPASFELHSAVLMSSGAICYTYRAANGFGGVNVEYAVETPKGKISILGTDGNGSEYEHYCQGKTGQELTEVR